LSEPARRVPLDVRVGSTPDALAPISVAERSLAAGPRQWLGLGLVVAAALVADQLTKRLVSSQLSLGEAVDLVGPFTIHHVQNSGIAFGLFSSATPIVIVLTGAAILAMALGLIAWALSQIGSGRTAAAGAPPFFMASLGVAARAGFVLAGDPNATSLDFKRPVTRR